MPNAHPALTTASDDSRQVSVAGIAFGFFSVPSLFNKTLSTQKDTFDFRHSRPDPFSANHFVLQ
jgi:hypothetical protein